MTMSQTAMDDSTFRKVHTLIDKLRRRTEATTRRDTLPSTDPDSDDGLLPTNGISIRDNLRKENGHLTDEPMGLIREASSVGAKAPVTKPTISTAAQAEASSSLRLVPRVGEVAIVPTQPHIETRLTLVPRIGTIEIPPTEMEAKVTQLTCVPRVGTTEIAPTQIQVEEKQPVFPSRVDREEIAPSPPFSKPFLLSDSASDQSGRHPKAKTTTPTPDPDAKPKLLPKPYHAGSVLDRCVAEFASNRRIATFSFEKETNNTTDYPKSASTRPAVINANPPRPGSLSRRPATRVWHEKNGRWIPIRLPTVPSKEYQVSRPWLFPGLNAPPELLQAATNRLTCRPDAPIRPNPPKNRKTPVSKIVSFLGGTVAIPSRTKSDGQGDATPLFGTISRTAPAESFGSLFGGRSTTKSPNKGGEQGKGTPAWSLFEAKAGSPSTSLEFVFKGTPTRGSSGPKKNLVGGSVLKEASILSKSSLVGSAQGEESMSEGTDLDKPLARDQDTDHGNSGGSQIKTSPRPSPGAIFDKKAHENTIFNFDYQPSRRGYWS